MAFRSDMKGIVCGAVFGLFVPVSPAVAQRVAGDSVSCTVPRFLATVSALSADSMEGRRPGRAGAMRAATLIASAYRDAGLEAPPGGWLQQVPLVSRQGMSASLGILGSAVRLTSGESGVLIESERAEPRIAGSANVVFVGFGIHAPDIGWDDFAAVEIRDRIVVALAGAPDTGATRLRWGKDDVRASDAYKLALARSRGARGVVLLNAEVRPPDPRGRLTLTNQRGALALVARLGKDASARFATSLGLALDARPTASARRIAFEVREASAPVDAANVIGMLPARSEDAGVVLLVAHYDHLGVRTNGPSTDSIYNGALDNASGVSALACLARRFASERDSLRRTLVFVATTAEEHQGHLGASWYAEHPVAPLDRTVVVLNIDGINTILPTEDFFALPGSLVDATDALESAGRAARMTLSQASFERGMDWSFDTEVFNRRGIPALTIWQGLKGRDVSPQEFFRQSRARNAVYHTPFDTVSGAWNAEAIEQHLRLLHAVGFAFAASSRRAVLRPDSPFAVWPR